jgi:hypothetical protein
MIGEVLPLPGSVGLAVERIFFSFKISFISFLSDPPPEGKKKHINLLLFSFFELILR